MLRKQKNRCPLVGMQLSAITLSVDMHDYPWLARFAQRVSLIKNKATVNENLDPDAVIRRLKNEILMLREEVSFLKVSNVGYSILYIYLIFVE